MRCIGKGLISDEDAALQLPDLKAQIAKIETTLRTPRPVPMSKAKLRAALEKRITDWRDILRDHENVELARAVIRRIIGPLELWGGPVPEVPERFQKYPAPGTPKPQPERVRFSAHAKPHEALDGLVTPSVPSKG